MAHFAELNNDNIVLRTVVISNDDMIDENGNEDESKGVAICRRIFGENTNWVQTSYNGNFRMKFALPGFKYLPEQQVFYDPIPPFPSFSLDENYDWQAPTPSPKDGRLYRWDEETQSWFVNHADALGDQVTDVEQLP